MPNPTLYASGTQLAVIGTEHFLSSPNAAGNFVPIVNTVNMALGDVLQLRVYQKVLTGDTPEVVYFMEYHGAQPADDRIKTCVPIGNDLVEANALRFSLTQTFGVGRNYKWKVLQNT